MSTLPDKPAGKEEGSIRSRVYASLKQDLLAGRVRPGELLQESELAGRFAVSKTPIREALSQLVAERFIKLIPRKGYWVPPVDPREVRDTLELRLILERNAMDLAARRITAAELAALEALILPQPAGGGGLGDSAHAVDAYSRTNIRFHEEVAVASGNQALARAVTRVLEDLTRVIFIYFSLPTIVVTSRDHGEIVDALRRRDPARARAVIESHLEVTRDELMRALVGPGPAAGGYPAGAPPEPAR